MNRATGIILVFVVVMLAGAGVVSRRARAQLADPPAKMDLVDAARLDAALARAQPYLNSVIAIAQRYQIQPLDLLTGRASVNVDTGNITRPEPQKGPSK